MSFLLCITGLTFCEVLEIFSRVTTCLEMTSFLEETNSSELTILLLVIVSLTGAPCIEAAGIGSTCIGDDSTGAVSIEIAASAFIRAAGVRGTD